MANSEVFKSTVESMFEGMEGFMSSKTVVGQPIEMGDTIIIPLVDVSFGMAAGSFLGDKKNNGAGGMGGTLKPSAVLVIHNGNTRLINVSTHSGMDKLLDMVPDFVDRFVHRKDGEHRGDEESRNEAAKEMEDIISDAVNEE